MEEAEHEFLRSLGLGVMCRLDGHTISWPRVNAECNYRSAVRFEEIIEIEITVERIGSRSVTYGFQFSRDEIPVADGQVTVVCCKFDHVPAREHPESVPIPPEFVDALTPYSRG